MITFKLNASNDIIPKDNGNGLITFEALKAPESISQLVPLRIMTQKKYRKYEPYSAIDWQLFFGQSLSKINKQLLPVLGSKLRVLILDTIGVTDVDLSKAQFDITPYLRFENICFTIGCERFEINL